MFSVRWNRVEAEADEAQHSLPPRRVNELLACAVQTNHNIGKTSL